MILRTGVDLIEIARVENVIRRHGQHYLDRVYTSAELEQCAGKAESLAGRFAAKEAVAKSLGTGIGPVTWQEVEVLGDELNAPLLTLRGEAQRLASEIGITTWSLSISHSQTHAVAVVVGIG